MDPVCGECQKSESHTNHCFKPLDEAAVDLKLDLKSKLNPLKERLKHFRNMKFTCVQTEEHIKVQTQHAETQITSEFGILHHFLWAEEASRIAALRTEMEQKTQVVKKTIAQLNGIILALSNKVTALEEEEETDNISFLQNYKATVEKAQFNLQDPKIHKGSLISVAKHLGNLTFRVWEKMRTIVQYTPVILDPNTAHPCLHISDDLTGVTLCNGDPWLPRNPERSDGYPSILGSEGFDSGRHSWVVEVGDSSAWVVGVICESVSKQRGNFMKHGLWQVGYYKGRYGKGVSHERLMPLPMKQTLQQIRVLLDWDGGLISFFDPLNNTHVHTFRETFTERVYPYFYSACAAQTLRVLPE
ncbi:nuclear factor 7, brain-like [Brachyhypopomus gauderio]|uniref:nuclear factor 7, brain-like n=1 Tax=Brachyhypopomus gauderio TaxID=698409 RepID=UPI00404132C8